MSYNRGKVELEHERFSSIVEVKHWRSLEDSEIYKFKVTNYSENEVTPLIEEEFEEGFVDEVKYTEEIFEYLDHEEFEVDETEDDLLERAEIPIEVKKALEQEGYKLNRA